VLKADVQGSLEAVTQSLLKLERDDVKVSFVHRAVGGITESDVTIAAASGATIIGFNVRPDRRARELAESHKVEIRTYEIIYKLIEDVQAAMVGMLAPRSRRLSPATPRCARSSVSRGWARSQAAMSPTVSSPAVPRSASSGTVSSSGGSRLLTATFQGRRPRGPGRFRVRHRSHRLPDLKDGDVIETYDEREIPRT